MNRTERGRGTSWRWGIPVVLLLLPILAWPLGALTWHALAADGAVTAAPLLDAARDRGLWERAAFTAAQAGASAAIAVALGLPAAYVVTRLAFPGRAILRALLTLPVVLPGIVLGVAVERLIADLLPAATTAMALPPMEVAALPAILLTHGAIGVAIVVRIVGGAWSGVDPRLEEAARLLGANRRRTFAAVAMPAILPATVAATALAFALAFSSLGVVLVLGDPGTETLAALTARVGVDTPEAALPMLTLVAALQIGVTLAVLLIYASVQRRIAARSRAGRRRGHGSPAWGSLALLAVLLTAVPLAALPVAGLLRAGAEAPIGEILRDDDLQRSAAWSAGLALAAAGGALLLGAPAALALGPARRGGRLAEALLLLPMAVPGVVLGVAFLVAFDRGWGGPSGSALLLVAAQALVAYPLALRTLLPTARRADPRLTQAAAILGASPGRAWRRVHAPAFARALPVAAVLAFLAALGDLGAALLLSRGGMSTLPVRVLEATGTGPATAAALSSLLLTVAVVAFLLIERYRYRGIGEW